MRQHSFTALAVLLAAPLAAQNIHPTIEVTGAYEGKLVEIRKPQQQMAVPDSVLRFDLDFGYSVFASPYRGAYDFEPYTVDMKPQEKVRERETLYFRAGAGYTLHPEAELRITPVATEHFRMGLYGGHRSYFGEYLPVDGVSDGGDGHAMRTRAGIAGVAAWKTGEFTFDAGYRHTGLRDAVLDRQRHEAAAALRVRSVDVRPGRFRYDVSFRYRYRSLDLYGAGNPFLEQRLAAEVTPGYALGDASVVSTTIGGDLYVDYGRYLYAVPRYRFTRRGVNIDLGVKGYLKEDGISLSDGGDPAPKLQHFFPDVHLSFPVVPGRLTLYAGVTGGYAWMDYGHAMAVEPWFRSTLWAVDAVRQERVRAAAGLRGNVAARLSFDLRAGYAVLDGDLLPGYRVGPAGTVVPLVGATAYHAAYADLSIAWRSPSVSVDGHVHYQHTVFTEDAGWGRFAPAPLSGDVSLRYDWNRRIAAGVSCGFATERTTVYDEAAGLSLPGYADLGAFAEYRLMRQLSVYVRGGNLLGMDIRRTLFHAEKGPYVTGGVCLTL